VGLDCPKALPPVHACGYSDELDCIGPEGWVPVPERPGLGATCGWDFIRANTRQRYEFT
jgi:L-alanine-DL-glutamate epimerase-like enolase superfamily enzyme